MRARHHGRPTVDRNSDRFWGPDDGDARTGGRAGRPPARRQGLRGGPRGAGRAGRRLRVACVFAKPSLYSLGNGGALAHVRLHFADPRRPQGKTRPSFVKTAVLSLRSRFATSSSMPRKASKTSRNAAAIAG